MKFFECRRATHLPVSDVENMKNSHNRIKEKSR